LLRITRTLALPLLAVQAVVNAFLAFWVYMEYVHNRFLREYLATFWTANLQTVAVVAASGIVGVGSLLYLAQRREALWVARDKATGEGEESLQSGLVPLDVCPVCNMPLKTLSEGRFQCRRCGRYFKK